MENRFIACMILHAVGDTVGYNNSQWEFMKGGYEITLEKVSEFIDLGGITHISLKNWIVSDDTILHIQTAKSILANFNSINSFCKILKKNLLESLEQFNDEGLQKRNPGKSTIESLMLLSKGKNWTKIPYNFYNGGSGASMRNLCIGLALHGEDLRHKLIQISIESSRLTNNSTIGYLGGLASALFTALAIEGKNINDWVFILLDLFNSGIIYKYIKSVNRDVNKFNEDCHIFLEKWHRYVDNKFDNNRNIIIRKSTKNLFYRSKYYHETFGMKNKNNNKIHFFIGSGGDDSVIIAYDCLLDSGNNWEKLVYYSMLHMGDTDTTGAIAGGFFGALYGYDNVPKNFIEHLEYKNILIDLGKQLYKKFYF